MPDRYFIMGASRSGSSLIELAVAVLTGGIALGETRWIFKRGCIDDDICGCGQYFSECPYWQKCVGPDMRKDAERLDALRAEFDNPLALFAARSLMRFFPARRVRYERYLEALRQTVGSVENCELPVVDNSKRPYYALALLDAFTGRPDETVYLHVLRDPLGVIESWSRKKVRKETRSKEGMQIFSKPVSCILWNLYVINQLLMRVYLWRSDHVYISFDRFQRTGELKTHHEGVVQAHNLSQMRLDSAAYHSMSGNPDRTEWADGVMLKPSTRKLRMEDTKWIILLVPGILAREMLRLSCRSSFLMSSGVSQES